MKKLISLLLGIIVGMTAFAQVKGSNLRPETRLVPAKGIEGLSAFNKCDAPVMANTRSWVDEEGYIWDMWLYSYGETIVDVFEMSEETEEFFENRPIYIAYCRLVQYRSDYSVENAIMCVLQWPSMYWYDQVDNYTGALDSENDIPIEERDLSIVPPEILLNPSSRVGKFTVKNLLGVGEDTWYIIPLSIRGSLIYQGSDVESIMDEGLAGILDFTGYDEEANHIDFSYDFPFKTTQGDISELKGDYAGEARVYGFEPKYHTTPEIADIHLFNTGVFSSDSFGYDNPFPENFDDLTFFYLVACPETIEFTINPDKVEGRFDTRAFSIKPAEGSVMNDWSYYQGYLFADKKYGMDITLDPEICTFNFEEAVEKEDQYSGMNYWSVVPKAGSFVTYGWYNTWSEEYGMKVICEGYYKNLTPSSYIEWGTVYGFESYMVTDFQEHISSIGTGDIIYHYDPTDMSKTRTFPSVNRGIPTGVEVDKNDDPVITTDGGVITVKASEPLCISVYSLDGKAIATDTAEELNVKAPKGIYMVKAGESTKKVLL